MLRLVFESPGDHVLDSPDNITVSPRGGLLLCEDGSGTQYLRGLNKAGSIFDFATNQVSGYEFAGATFSPTDISSSSTFRGRRAAARPTRTSSALASRLRFVAPGRAGRSDG